MNYKVFPATLINGQKVPLFKGWREAATTDENQIKQWSEQFRERLTFFGLPCGPINNILVLDVDVKKANGFDALKNLGHQIPTTLTQRTPSGGYHFIFKFDPARDTGNKVGFIPGCDIRSTGGWIAFYGFINNVPVADAPEWLYKEASKVVVDQVLVANVRLAPEIAQKIFYDALENIRHAPEGESNNVLNIEAYKVGQLVASEALTRQFAEVELFKAAKERGKPDYEAKATITSGLDGGAKHPLTTPFGADAPAASFAIPTLPAPPDLPTRWTPRYLTRTDLLNTSKLRKPQLFRDWSTEDISITTADGGTGKTTLKLYEAVCLALGDRFLGFDNCQRGRTLFITGEDSEAKLAAILGAIMKQMGLFEPGAENEAKVDTVLASVLIKKDADLCLIAKDKGTQFLRPNEHAMGSLLQACEDIKPKMVVLDPISSFWGSEAALNDMNKAVTRFASEIVDKVHCNFEMINHMGKSSSAQKDMSQFAGRGGSGLPSNSRVSRVLRSLGSEEYQDMTGQPLPEGQSAMLCNVNKFSDGSPLMNVPFVILRVGYLFSRITLSPQKARELEKEMDDKERVFTYIKACRTAGKYPTRSVVTGHFMNGPGPMSAERIKRAVNLAVFEGHMGEKVMEIDNPNLTIRDKALIITDMDEKELYV